MGRSLNKVMVIGNLCRDPEVRYMPNGNAVANVSVATDESYNDKTTGQKVEQSEFHRITVYGKLAEIVQQYLKKGSRAYFEGKLRTREWEKDGVKRYTTEIIASDMMMLDRAGNQTGTQPNNQAQQHGQNYAPQQQQPQQQQQQQPQPGYGQPQYQAAPQQQPAPAQYQQYQPPQNGFEDFDDDVPF
ncbi:single-stranded DNA-binding protein [Oceanospirillaceae bacterium ASx5O]|nr:single-stranded DNA-binding protein [Oceanospirillaceae bacterium ASx5O]